MLNLGRVSRSLNSKGQGKESKPIPISPAFWEWSGINPEGIWAPDDLVIFFVHTWASLTKTPNYLEDPELLVVHLFARVSVWLVGAVEGVAR
jgi:hypothetical protein